MAQSGEIEVFRISPEEGKCYEHIEATRLQYIGAGKSRYFSSNQPRYVGKFIRKERGYGDGGKAWAIFNDNDRENRVEYSYEGNTCFTEVPCKLNKGAKGGSKKTRKSRKTKKSRKNRK